MKRVPFRKLGLLKQPPPRTIEEMKKKIPSVSFVTPSLFPHPDQALYFSLAAILIMLCLFINLLVHLFIYTLTYPQDPMALQLGVGS